MLQRIPTLLATTALFVFVGCGDSGHSHGGGGGGHHHDEVPLGSVQVGDDACELAAGHGPVSAGGDEHLCVKLPYNDGGESIIRVWIGTEDRTQSEVAKAKYAPDHDDYDVHLTAPDPLPDNCQWWIEIEKPDGTRATGSLTPEFE